MCREQIEARAAAGTDEDDDEWGDDGYDVAGESDSDEASTEVDNAGEVAEDDASTTPAA